MNEQIPVPQENSSLEDTGNQVKVGNVGEHGPGEEQQIDVGKMIKENPEYAAAVAARQQEMDYVPLKGTMEMLGVKPEDALKRNQAEGPSYREIAGQYLTAASEKVSQFKGKIGGFVNRAGLKLASFGVRMQEQPSIEGRGGEQVRFFKVAELQKDPRYQEAVANMKREEQKGPAARLQERYGGVVNSGVERYAGLMQRADGARTMFQEAVELARQGQERRVREEQKLKAKETYRSALLKFLSARRNLMTAKLQFNKLAEAAA